MLISASKRTQDRNTLAYDLSGPRENLGMENGYDYSSEGLSRRLVGTSTAEQALARPFTTLRAGVYDLVNVSWPWPVRRWVRPLAPKRQCTGLGNSGGGKAGGKLIIRGVPSRPDVESSNPLF